MEWLKKIKEMLRQHKRYLLTLVNESTLAPVLQISARSTSILIAALLVLALSGCGWYLMFRYTPMRGLLPMRIDTSLRDDYERMADRLDSLTDMAAVNDRFARNIVRLLTDTVPVAITDTVGTNLYDLPLDSLMEAGSAEARFVKQYESSARLNLSVLSPVAAEGMIFYPPVSGHSLKSNSADTDLPAVTITSGASIPVSAAYRGTVIDAYYTTTKGITLVIQHPNNFISQYSGLTDVFVVRGAKVNAGQRIGISENERYPLTFMLWHEGTALDPADYIKAPQSTPTPVDEPFARPKARRR